MAMLSIVQLRAARALLNWTQEELAHKVGVSIPTIKRLEKQGIASTKLKTAMMFIEVFLGAGIEFIDDPQKEGAVLLKSKNHKAPKIGSILYT